MSPHQRLVEHVAAGTVDAEDSAHASRCAACGALLSGRPPELAGPKLRPEVLEAARQELRRPLRPWWTLPAGLAALNALLAALAVVVLEPWNWVASTSPRWLFLGTAILLAGIATAGLVLALAPQQKWLKGALLLAALAPLAVLLAADGRVANARFGAGATCLLTVVALSILPLFGGAWLLARVAYSPARALAVGLVSAGVGLLVLQFHCADGGSPHLVAFHLLPWAALGAAAVGLRRLLPTRSHAP